MYFFITYNMQNNSRNNIALRDRRLAHVVGLYFFLPELYYFITRACGILVLFLFCHGLFRSECCWCCWWLIFLALSFYAPCSTTPIPPRGSALKWPFSNWPPLAARMKAVEPLLLALSFFASCSTRIAAPPSGPVGRACPPLLRREGGQWWLMHTANRDHLEVSAWLVRLKARISFNLV